MPPADYKTKFVDAQYKKYIDGNPNNETKNYYKSGVLLTFFVPWIPLSIKIKLQTFYIHLLIGNAIR